MKPKTKMKIRTAVADYFKMFPKDWETSRLEIERQRQNLKRDFAEIDGTHFIKRALYTIPALLSTMLYQKLTEEERATFSSLENQRWFADEFPQFRITKRT